ncbi:MAG: CRISPR-associated ring nuclease Csm6 [Thiomicrospira sp.]|jgi:CRISPR-associated protein (TIGR02584 family)|nr:CRISPR-associated ring nuclease Csm6 [Thiomicrospira sp.]
MLELKTPQAYPRRVLFSVLGLSPQILTETLYALMKSDEPFVPTEVHVLTTTKGAEYCRLALFQENGGWFYRLCEDYGLSGVHFNVGSIHTLRDACGREIEDIRTPSENNAVANQISQYVREFTADAACALHVSIAGGRKTMGFYAGYALSMFGRAQDRLSHVLVAPAFEGHPKFFYPTPYPSVIRTRDDKGILEVDKALVELAYLPIVRMREALDTDLLAQSRDFSDLVNQLQRRLVEDELVLMVAEQRLQVGEVSIKLSPINFLFYYWLVRRHLAGLSGIHIPPPDVPDVGYRDEFMRLKDEVVGLMRDMERSETALKHGMTKEFIQLRKTEIKKKLQQALGVNSQAYLIHAVRQGRKNEHKITLPIEKIRIVYKGD